MVVHDIRASCSSNAFLTTAGFPCVNAPGRCRLSVMLAWLIVLRRIQRVGPAVFEDVVVSGLKANPLLRVWSSFFRRVVISWKIGKLNFNLCPWTFCKDPAVLSSFSEARAEFYSGTD